MLAIVGGTGFADLAGLTDARTLRVDTPWGEAVLQTGKMGVVPVIFLCRHGFPPSVPPHRINYRANIQALKDSGATAIVAVTAVGSVDSTLAVPAIVIPDQIIDYTWGRAHTFFDDRIQHIDFSFPYDADLRARLVKAALRVVSRRPQVAVRIDGVYGCTQGPRLETAAEIVRLARDGCHIVGMTAMPEVSLARELGLPYAGLSVVVNAGAGIDGFAVDLSAIGAAMNSGMEWAGEIVRALVQG